MQRKTTYKLLLIIWPESGFRIQVLQRLCQRLQCLDSVRPLAAYMFQSRYSAYLTSVPVHFPQAVLFTATASTRAYISHGGSVDYLRRMPRQYMHLRLVQCHTAAAARILANTWVLMAFFPRDPIPGYPAMQLYENLTRLGHLWMFMNGLTKRHYTAAVQNRDFRAFEFWCCTRWPEKTS